MELFNNIDIYFFCICHPLQVIIIDPLKVETKQFLKHEMRNFHSLLIIPHIYEHLWPATREGTSPPVSYNYLWRHYNLNLMIT